MHVSRSNSGHPSGLRHCTPVTLAGTVVPDTLGLSIPASREHLARPGEAQRVCGRDRDFHVWNTASPTIEYYERKLFFDPLRDDL